jgi:hypothetical protein
MQITLLNPEPLDPLPTSSGHYVAVLQSQPGERDALRNAAGATWERMTPLVEIVGPKDRTKVFPVATVRGWLKRVSEAVGAHPIYLDLVRLNPAAKVTTTKGTSAVLREVYVAARRRGIRFVPVLRVGESTKAHVALMCEAMDEDGHGIALRYGFLNAALPTGATRATLLRSTLTEIGSAVEHADLLLDLDYLDPDVDVDITMLADSINEMVAVGEWRSVVLIGTTMPETLSCIDQGTVGTLPRREWDIWTEIAASGVKRVPAYGDYAVQNPHPPHDGGGPGMRANIRYTAADATLVARGEGSLIQEGSDQYRDLCEQLVARPEFSGRDYTWGDGVIAGCADGSVEPGWQNQWRGAGTSHHLRFVTDQLRALHP